MKKIISSYLFAIVCFSITVFSQIPVDTLINISKAEDELRFDKVLEDLLNDKDARIRARAALAAGRIGNDAAIPDLSNLLENDKEQTVRAMAAFAIGEIESVKGAGAVLKVLANTKDASAVRARAVEAVGKIAAANPKDEKAAELGKAILAALEFEEQRSAKMQSKETVLLGITAALRAKAEGTDLVVAKFLTNPDARVRADAANTLARLKSKNSNEKFRPMLRSDANGNARANAARALGAAEDKDSLDLLIKAATTDTDLRVRISAIRSLGSLKDEKAADKLMESGEKLLAAYKKSKFANPVEKNELLEIATALGRILEKTENKKALDFLNELNRLDKYQSPETEIAIARIIPKSYYQMQVAKKNEMKNTWQSGSAVSQATSAISDFYNSDENKELKAELARDIRNTFSKLKEPTRDKNLLNALPDILSSYAQLKTDDLDVILREYLTHSDVFIRTTAAGLLGDQPATKENVEALKTAFAAALKADIKYDDAQLAILSALVKLDKNEATDSLRLALDAPGILVRRQAANLIKQNDLTKDFPDYEKKVGTVKLYDAKTGTKLGQVLSSDADYRRAVSRKNGTVKAVLTTDKGKLTIDLLPENAPLTVDNFIKLANSGYFNNVAIHRVVGNFVVQDGDPLGNGSGGPGWQIRCELNTVPYKRGAVGMALSGKDTGGSQWFITHSPQPHLDGGYTVFGSVNEKDMKIVDTLVRGDKILKVEIAEKSKQ